jgi:hypothetical protein
MPKFCEKCGSPLTPGKMFCEECGEPVESTTEPVREAQPAPSSPGLAPPAASPAPSPAKPRPKIALIGIIVVIIIVIALAAVLLLPKIVPEPIIGTWKNDTGDGYFQFSPDGTTRFIFLGLNMNGGNWTKVADGRYRLTDSLGQDFIVYNAKQDSFYFEDDPAHTYHRITSISQTTTSTTMTISPTTVPVTTTVPGTVSASPTTRPAASGLKYGVGDIIQGVPGDAKFFVLGANPADKKYTMVMVTKYSDGKYHARSDSLEYPIVENSAETEKYYGNKIDHIDPGDVVYDLSP